MNGTLRGRWVKELATAASRDGLERIYSSRFHSTDDLIWIPPDRVAAAMISSTLDEYGSHHPSLLPAVAF